MYLQSSVFTLAFKKHFINVTKEQCSQISNKAFLTSDPTSLTFICNSTIIYTYLSNPTLTQRHKGRINGLQIDLSAYPVPIGLCFFVLVITWTDSRSRQEAMKTTSYIQGNPSLSEPVGQSTITGCGGCYKLTCYCVCACACV